MFILVLLLASCANETERKVKTEVVGALLEAEQRMIEEALIPVIKFESDSFDFGEMYQDETVTNEFKLRNIGDAPLLIRSAKGSCGCTVADWPREPVAPEENSIIKVTFSSEKRKGKQNKTVSLVTNAIPSTQVLTIKGTVLVSKNN